MTVCSDPELIEQLGELTIFGIPSTPTLKASDTEGRAKIIEAVRAGKHVEVQFRARVWRQRDGSPNKNFYRIAPAKASAWAESFTGKPFLIDHRSWMQEARKGTIVASVLEQQAHGWIAMLQDIRAVKPEAVISVLDGTIDRFSVGWSRNGGAVICTVHKQDRTRRGSCDCWPGDRVIGDDGKEQVVEFEWQTPEGTETSGVNTPAVSGTRIHEIRAALSAELGVHGNNNTEQDMTFEKLAKLLGLAALASSADEDRALRVVEELKRDKLAAEQERDTAIKRAETAEDQLSSAVEERKTAAQLARKTNVDAMLENAYHEGRLLHGHDAQGKATPSLREERLRRIGMEEGEEVLAKELGEMPRLVPLRTRVVKEDDAQPARTSHNAPPSKLREEVARQLGLDPKQLEATEARLRGEG